MEKTPRLATARGFSCGFCRIVAIVIVGILSDTHGRREIAKRAIALLCSRGAQQIVHCGDVGETDILDLLAGDPPAAFVFGNNDLDREALAKYAESIGVTCLKEFGTLTVDDRVIAVTHGDRGSLVRRAIDDPAVSYLLVGHTHVAADTRQRHVRVINPGALYRAARKSVALLNLKTDTLEFVTIESSS